MAATANQVQINTNYGAFTVELYPDKAPVTVANFLRYVDEDYYSNTIFHRVISNFVVQGGGYTTSLLGKATHDPIALETNNGLSNWRGTLAMARTDAANSATSQFYVNTVDNLNLDYQSATSPGYAVFGHVVDGMDVVDAIESAHTLNVRVSNSFVFADIPFPNYVKLLSAERYQAVDAASAVATSHSTTSNAYGVTQAVYSGARVSYSVKLNSDGSHAVNLLDGSHKAEQVAADRLVFSDSKFAYDMDGSAGKTALLINAAFGYTFLQPELNSIGLGLFDQGKSMLDVATLALGTDLWRAIAGGTDNAAFVKAVYQHVVGAAPDAANLAYFQGMLDRAEMSQAQMLTMAANTDINAVFIDLVGMTHTGLQYV